MVYHLGQLMSNLPSVKHADLGPLILSLEAEILDLVGVFQIKFSKGLLGNYAVIFSILLRDHNRTFGRSNENGLSRRILYVLSINARCHAFRAFL